MRIHVWRWMKIALALGLGGFCACSTPEHAFEDGGVDGGGVDGGGGAGCGDGTISGAEECDGVNLGGATCASTLGPGHFAAPGQALSCGVDCRLDTSACSDACMLDVAGSQLDSCVLQ